MINSKMKIRIKYSDSVFETNELEAFLTSAELI